MYIKLQILVLATLVMYSYKLWEISQLMNELRECYETEYEVQVDESVLKPSICFSCYWALDNKAAAGDNKSGLPSFIRSNNEFCTPEKFLADRVDTQFCQYGCVTVISYDYDEEDPSVGKHDLVQMFHGFRKCQLPTVGDGKNPKKIPVMTEVVRSCSYGSAHKTGQHSNMICYCDGNLCNGEGDKYTHDYTQTVVLE